ncbi:MAG: DegT/DnrJ/EryC1/StrS family aminotransferase [Gammaproteobacteria bacterium]|nr:DegT/DnrJ/EryC1/StrS family aminotransferase [Gammaproteobacteria bacterium]
MNIDVACLEEKLLAAERTGTLPKIIVAVHFAGLSCDMQSIKELADKYNIRIIEDACHAIGGSYKDSMIGSCCYSDITVFSFHPVKIITTGEGGMLTTNSESLFQKIVLLRSHGINRKEFSYKTESDGDWYYEQSILGFNYRLTDIQSALGLSQLKRIDSFINTRTQLALNYNDSLKDFSLTTPEFYSDIKSAWHLYIVKLNMGFDRSEIYAQMQAAGIGVNVHYIPIHTQPYYRRLGFKPGDFPRAEQYYSQALTLPLYPALEQQQYVIDTLEQSLA